MFHDLLDLLKECVPLSTIAMVASNVSFVHMPLLIIEGSQLVVVLIFFFVGQE
jgi:hypothetical protein